MRTKISRSEAAEKNGQVVEYTLRGLTQTFSRIYFVLLCFHPFFNAQIVSYYYRVTKYYFEAFSLFVTSKFYQ